MKQVVIKPRRIGLSIRLKDRTLDNQNMLAKPLLTGQPFKKPFY